MHSTAHTMLAKNNNNKNKNQTTTTNKQTNKNPTQHAPSPKMEWYHLYGWVNNNKTTKKATTPKRLHTQNLTKNGED